MHPYRMARGRRTTCGLHRRRICCQSLAHLLRARRRTPGEAHGDCLGVALDDRYARTARRYAQGCVCVHFKREPAAACNGFRLCRFRLRLGLGELAEDLECLPLDLLLLARDVRHDVVEYVQRGYAGVPRAGDGLQRRDDARLYRAERTFERREGYHDARRRAVRVGDDEALLQRGRVERALLGDDVEVRRVD